MKKVAVALLAVIAVAGLALSVAAQDQMKAEKAMKQARWEGTITRSDKDASTLTVRKSGGNIEKVERLSGMELGRRAAGV